MNDESSNSLVQSLKNEWALFWESISGDEPAKGEDPFQTGHIKVLSLEDLRSLTRDLSQNRKRLNQRLESLGKELDLNSAKLESLRAVGEDEKPVLEKINELHDFGQKVSHELSQLDQRLKIARDHEDHLRRQLTPA